jgi:CRISPR-associated exonuclease Cas4
METCFITPSEVIEYMYCPRFIYYMNVLKVQQHEHGRHLVNKGRLIHEQKLVSNKDYLRKKVGAVDKELDVYLTSEKLRLVGRMDEVLYLSDGSMAPLDYKYAIWEKKIYKTLLMQQTLYALLIEEHYAKPVNKAFLVYVRSKNHLEEVYINPKMKASAIKVIDSIFEIIDLSLYPKSTAHRTRCADCTYRNICVS